MGPDVLALLPDAKELTDMGIPRGDAYRLKHAADEWLADDTRQHKRQRTDTSQERVHSVSVAAPQAVHQQIGFTNNPPRPNPEHERTDAERAGRPYPGTKGNYMWEERFPDGGARTFWANMPSPTLGPRDPLLAPPGTVFLGVGGGEYIEVLRAPRYDLVTEEVDESIQDIFDKLQSQVE
ncbi:hypothetical protein FRC12_020184 [Ceratobasidium sp. 428]|nr:hypothetical protein FRC12_020184 [Ceratobasidium sp. 428]